MQVVPAEPATMELAAPEACSERAQEPLVSVPHTTVAECVVSSCRYGPRVSARAPATPGRAMDNARRKERARLRTATTSNTRGEVTVKGAMIHNPFRNLPLPVANARADARFALARQRTAVWGSLAKRHPSWRVLHGFHETPPVEPLNPELARDALAHVQVPAMLYLQRRYRLP